MGGIADVSDGSLVTVIYYGIIAIVGAFVLTGIIRVTTRKRAPPPRQVMRPRKSIPKPLREQVWRKYFGTSTDGVCQGICKPRTRISAFSFECGHIVAHARGGDAAVENLVPLCSACNKSMGDENFRDWKHRYD